MALPGTDTWMAGFQVAAVLPSTLVALTRPGGWRTGYRAGVKVAGPVAVARLVMA